MKPASRPSRHVSGFVGGTHLYLVLVLTIMLVVSLIGGVAAAFVAWRWPAADHCSSSEPLAEEVACRVDATGIA